MTLLQRHSYPSGMLGMRHHSTIFPPYVHDRLSAQHDHVRVSSNTINSALTRRMLTHLRSLKKIALKLGTDGPHKVLQTPRLVQLLFNGAYIIKTTKAVFVWEHPFYPQFYIPASEFSSKSAHPSLKCQEGEAYKSDSGAVLATQWTLSVGDRSIEDALVFSPDLSGPAKDLSGLGKSCTYFMPPISLTPNSEDPLPLDRPVVRRIDADLRTPQRSLQANRHPPVDPSHCHQSRRQESRRDHLLHASL